MLRAALRRLSPAPQPAALEADVAAALPLTGPPDVQAAVEGPDVGVAVRGGDDCLLGARVDGTIQVWRPSGVQLQPGELTCDPQTALAALGQQAPH